MNFEGLRFELTLSRKHKFEGIIETIRFSHQKATMAVKAEIYPINMSELYDTFKSKKVREAQIKMVPVNTKGRIVFTQISPQFEDGFLKAYVKFKFLPLSVTERDYRSLPP